MKPHQAEVVNCVVANTRYGKKLVFNCKLLPSKEKVACWSNELDNPIYRSKRPGQFIELIESDKGKFSVLDREPPRNINGNGLKSVNEIIPNIPKSNGATTQQIASSTNQRVASDAVDDYLSNDLGLPELFTDKQKQDLSKLTQERARLLVFCIETMKNEMDAKGLEVYESSVKSLGVSLFIHLNKYLP